MLLQTETFLESRLSDKFVLFQYKEIVDRPEAWTVFFIILGHFGVHYYHQSMVTPMTKVVYV